MVTTPAALLRPGFKASTLIVFNVSNVQIFIPISCEGCPSGTSPSPQNTHISSLQLNFNVYILPTTKLLQEDPVQHFMQTSPSCYEPLVIVNACKCIVMSDYIYRWNSINNTPAWSYTPCKNYDIRNTLRALVLSTRCLVRGQLGIE